jgi:hypothetical protein
MTSYTDEFVQLQRMDAISRKNGIVQIMVNDHLEFTRGKYIELNWDVKPEPWEGEHEAMLPPIFRIFND